MIFFSKHCKLVIKTIPIVFTLILFTCITPQAFSQKKEFEGIIQYKVEVKSKLPGISDKLMETYLGLGDALTVHMKKGNYRRTTAIHEEYYVPAKKKVYIKFKNIDTLYFVEYNSDTSTVLNVLKSEEQKEIAGYLCNAISINSTSSAKKYYYAPQLYNNPAWDKENKLGNLDRLTNETESVWLSLYEDATNYQLTETAIKVQVKEIDDEVFVLPELPEKLFTIASVTKEPEFARSGGWHKYLETNANGALGSKHIKIPKGQNSAQQVVNVSFLVSERGEIQEVKVLNPKEVHPKLAEEAIRVVSESRGWKPATVYGIKIPFRLNQPITFGAIK